MNYESGSPFSQDEELSLKKDEAPAQKEKIEPLHFPEETQEQKELAALTEKVAGVIIENSLKIKSGDKLVILMHPSGWNLANAVTRLAQERNAEVQIRFYFPEMAKVLLESLKKDEDSYSLPLEAREHEFPEADTPAAMIHYGIGNDQLEAVNWGTKYLIIRNKVSSGNQYDIDPEHQKIYDSVDGAIVRFRNDDREKRMALIYEPNQEEADLAGLSLEEYRKLYYDAIDRPWEKIKETQQFLIEYLSTKKELSVKCPAPAGLPPGWDTDITMSIEGMKGANSTIDTNLPGSEVFMAPVAETLKGTYAIPYPVQFKDRVLPNVKFIFESGKIKSFDIWYQDSENPQRKADIEYVQKIITTDAGASTIGEIGMGTNAVLDKPYLNSLLIEKVGGSVHLAIGNSYANKGEAIIDNGNRSAVHIDLTRILSADYGGGTISADGEVFQKNGKFLPPELQVLNEK